MTSLSLAFLRTLSFCLYWQMVDLDLGKVKIFLWIGCYKNLDARLRKLVAKNSNHDLISAHHGPCPTPHLQKWGVVLAISSLPRSSMLTMLLKGDRGECHGLVATPQAWGLATSDASKAFFSHILQESPHLWAWWSFLAWSLPLFHFSPSTFKLLLINPFLCFSLLNMSNSTIHQNKHK